MKRINNLQGSKKISAWAVIGLVIGVVFGLVWRVFDPSLAIYFWPAFGALMFGQHAYRSNRRIRNKDKPESAPPTR